MRVHGEVTKKEKKALKVLPIFPNYETQLMLFWNQISNQNNLMKTCLTYTEEEF